MIDFQHIISLLLPKIMASYFPQLLSLLTLLSIASASPIANANGNEIYYLANCAQCDITTSGCQFYHSSMAYYPIESKSEHQETPQPAVPATFLIPWEGNIVEFGFPMGNFTVQINADANAKNKVLYDYVGNGTATTSKLCLYLRNKLAIY